MANVRVGRTSRCSPLWLFPRYSNDTATSHRPVEAVGVKETPRTPGGGGKTTMWPNWWSLPRFGQFASEKCNVMGVGHCAPRGGHAATSSDGRGTEGDTEAVRVLYL